MTTVPAGRGSPVKRLELEAPLGRTLREQVLARIRQAIVQGELAPGEPLRQDQLAEWLGVSSTPVREAIADLAREQLVDLEPNRGAHVRPLTLKGSIDFLRTYRLLFEGAYAWGLPNLTDGHYRQIDKFIDDLGQCCENGDFSRAFDLDMKIHEMVFDASDNGDLTALLESLKSRVARLINLRLPTGIWAESIPVYQQLFAFAQAGAYGDARSLLAETWDMWEQETAASFVDGSSSPADH